MKQPLVSVCIITYNHEKFIRQCLEGVMMQKTNFAFDVIVGEDKSTDNTAAVVKEFEAMYPDVIKPVYHQKNVGGVMNAYHYCYPMLTGKFIAICEGDDYWTDPYKLQKQVDFLLENPEYVMCFHKVSSVDGANQFIGRQQHTDIIKYEPGDIFHLSIPTLSVVFRKSFDIVPKDMFSVRSCDTFLFGLLAQYGKAADLGFIGAAYRMHNGGIYNSRPLIDRFRQGIETRKTMKRSTAFSIEQKAEIGREILKRKLFYFKYFLKKKELVNSFKIVFA